MGVLFCCRFYFFTSNHQSTAMISNVTRVRAIERVARASNSLRSYSNEISQPLSLISKSSLIRPLAGPSNATDNAAIQRDFKFWPNFFTEEESSEILKMALWKLDRADSTRRRRRPTQVDQSPQSQNGLQIHFHGEYGFEEVSLVIWSLHPAELISRDTMTL